ncbi:DMT family transporter [Oricola thermophila]|uniref:DMT family transporter n=2 Tax=Oricola thermophila TaxID=2742145 RepID=A0A6N1VJ95_9HYPH|nr:DMT family transporter [Oricola thermophila]
MTSFWFALFIVFAGGIALGMQAPVNAALSRAIGDNVSATMISFGIGFIVLTLLAAFRGTLPAIGTLRTAPPWMFAGGLLGAFYVWAVVSGVSRLGVVTMTAALILGQMIAAAVIDGTGAFGIPVNAISWQRVVAIVLVGAGLVISRL